MGFMDKVKSIGDAGKEKLDAVQAKRRADALFRDLGALHFAERMGRAAGDVRQQIEDLIAKLQAHEAEHGQISTATEADGGAAAAAPQAPMAAPMGGGIPQAAPMGGGIPQPVSAPGVPVPEAAPAPSVGDPLPDAASAPPVMGQPAVPQASPMAPPAGGSFIPGAPAEAAPPAAPPVTESSGEPQPGE